jgi:hypothetical protein
MSRLALWIGGLIFIAAAIVVLFSGGGWQSALVLAAVGAGIVFFLVRG